MISYLLDTNVVSELIKSRPDPGVRRWMQQRTDVHLCVLNIGELTRGAWRLRARNAERSERLHSWIEELERDFGETVLPVHGAVAKRWARLPAKRTLPVIDALLAATALEHGLVVVTRNEKDFVDTGVETLNPFEG